MATKTGFALFKRNVLSLGVSLSAALILAACGASTPSTTSTTAATTAPTTAPAATVAATEAPATSAPAEPTAETATEAPATVAATEPAATEPAAAVRSVASVYQIDPAQSEASFTLNEKLMGEDKTVIGTTSKLSGVISVTADNPSNSQIGAIQIDASSFSTDSNMRNGAIQRFVLQTSQHPFITFEPTAIEGLPTEAVSVGIAIPVKVTGNLTIRDIVQPVTFDATLTVKSDTELEGTAKTTITRTAFELTIPDVPSVADVTDNVDIQIQFVATKQA